MARKFVKVMDWISVSAAVFLFVLGACLVYETNFVWAIVFLVFAAMMPCIMWSARRTLEVWYGTRAKERGEEAKHLLVTVGAGLGMLLLIFAYLAVIGKNEGIEARSTNNVVAFSDAATAEQAVNLSTSFKPFENVEVRLDGIAADKGSLGANEVLLRVEMTGQYRRRLFDSAEYFVCTHSEMKEAIEGHLTSATGDTGLQITRLNLGHLAER